MHVRTVAATLGLTPNADGELFGTIEEQLVLTALEELSAAHPDHADLFILAADKVRSSRSAGVETLDDNSVFNRYRDSNQIQLRHRGEMAEIFDDLTIDLGLRGVAVAPPSADDHVGV